MATEYIVLESWSEKGRKAASSPTAAIREVAGENEGSYVAVPVRSWHPLRLKVKTEKRVVLSDEPELREAKAADI